MKEHGVNIIGSDGKTYFVPHDCLTTNQQNALRIPYLLTNGHATHYDHAPMPEKGNVGPNPSFPDPAKLDAGDMSKYAKAVRRSAVRQARVHSRAARGHISGGQQDALRDMLDEFWNGPVAS